MNKFSLLYVEDDSLTQKIFTSIFSKYFKTIYIANNGVEGLMLYKSKEPDIVLADISMPQMNGIEMCQKIKAIKPQQHIILFSGYSDVNYFSKAIDLKIDKFIEKPLVYKDVLKVFEEVASELEKERAEVAYQRELEFSSSHDILTGLGNRKFFFTRLKPLLIHSHKEGKVVAILSMDLNKFKPINDTYGHDAGDLVLQKVALYLEKSLRKSDVISRFGGDEFVIAVGFLNEPNYILKFLERLEKNFLEPVLYRDDDGVSHNINISFSMGITFSVPADSTLSADTFLRQADKAMYRAKELSIPYTFFNPNEESEVQIKSRKAQEIKNAIERGEFLLYYQPIIDIESSKVVAFESFLRWKHPTKGFLRTDKFLPYILDELEMEIYITTWVIENVFEQYEKWLLSNEEIALSINLSLKEFHSEEFIYTVNRLLQKYSKVNPKNIFFEIDEETIIKDMTLERSTLKMLKELGFQITLDGFGTGLSTLLYMKQFNIDRIKIDKSFVTDMFENKENYFIVDASIKLANVFGYKVIAMGIESVDGLPNLLKLGCNEAQGYGIARPMPVSEVFLLNEKSKSYL